MARYNPQTLGQRVSPSLNGSMHSLIEDRELICPVIFERVVRMVRESHI